MSQDAVVILFSMSCMIALHVIKYDRPACGHVLCSMRINVNANAFLNEPVSPFPGWLVLNGGYITGCTLRGQEETKHALVTSKVHLHSLFVVSSGNHCFVTSTLLAITQV